MRKGLFAPSNYDYVIFFAIYMIRSIYASNKFVHHCLWILEYRIIILSVRIKHSIYL